MSATGRLSFKEPWRIVGGAAQAICPEPDLLVLDEPTAGLDDALADCAVDCILRVCREEGTICIAAMHDVERAAEFGMIPMRLEPTAQGAVLATVVA